MRRNGWSRWPWWRCVRRRAHGRLLFGESSAEFASRGENGCQGAGGEVGATASGGLHAGYDGTLAEKHTGQAGGNKGGDGGDGGDGGAGRDGGDGGGGAGGTIKLFSSLLSAATASVDTSGGSQGASNAGGHGRLILGSNTSLSFDGDAVAAIGGAPLEANQVHTTTSLFVGPREDNPFLADSPDFLETTPVIAGLAGARTSLVCWPTSTGATSTTIRWPTARTKSPDHALVAVFRFDHGVLVNASGQLDASIDYTGFDMVVVVNMTNINLPLPRLGLIVPGSEQLDFAQGLAIAGLGETTSLASLPAGTAWATLVPETDDLLVNASLTFDGPDDPTNPLVQVALNRGTAEFVVSFVSAQSRASGPIRISRDSRPSRSAPMASASMVWMVARTCWWSSTRRDSRNGNS